MTPMRRYTHMFTCLLQLARQPTHMRIHKQLLLCSCRTNPHQHIIPDNAFVGTLPIQLLPPLNTRNSQPSTLAHFHASNPPPPLTWAKHCRGGWGCCRCVLAKRRRYRPSPPSSSWGRAPISRSFSARRYTFMLSQNSLSSSLRLEFVWSSFCTFT